MISLKPEFDLRRELDPKDPKLRSRNARDRVEPGSKPSKPEEDFLATSEVNTCRFWLMLKLNPKLKWEKRWEIYQAHLRAKIAENLISDDEQAKRATIREIAAKIEAKAWATMPTEFQKRMGVDRVLRH
jgi:hypothetical protein